MDSHSFALSGACLPGLLAGIAVLIRPTYGLHVIILAVAVGFASHENVIRRVAFFLMSSAIPFATFCIVYAIAGHLSDFWYATFVFTTSVYNPVPRCAILFMPAIYLGLIPALALIGSISCGPDARLGVKDCCSSACSAQASFPHFCFGDIAIIGSRSLFLNNCLPQLACQRSFAFWFFAILLANGLETWRSCFSYVHPFR